MLIIVQSVMLLMGMVMLLPFCLWLTTKLVRGLVYCLFVICVLMVFGGYGIWIQISKFVQSTIRKRKRPGLSSPP